MATTLINFDTGYSIGSVNGQNGWVGDPPTDLEVQNAVSHSSPNALKRKSGGTWSAASREFEAAGTAYFSCYARIQSNHPDPYRAFQIALGSGGSVFYNIGTNGSGTIGFQGSSGASLGSYSMGTWYKFEVEWDFATQKARARFNEGSWSSWISPISGTWTTLNKLTFISLSGEFYIDDIEWITPTPPEVYAISGVVRLAGSPVEGATVRCIRQSDNTTLAAQITDESGVYSFEDLEETELYHLCVEYEIEEQKYFAKSYWDIAPYLIE